MTELASIRIIPDRLTGFRLVMRVKPEPFGWQYIGMIVPAGRGRFVARTLKTDGTSSEREHRSQADAVAYIEAHGLADHHP